MSSRLLGIAQHLGIIRRIREYPIVKVISALYNIQQALCLVMELMCALQNDMVGMMSGTKSRGARVLCQAQKGTGGGCSMDSLSLDVGRNKGGTSSGRSAGSFCLHKLQASACGPSTDEMCCIFEMGRAELEDVKCVCK